MSNYDKEIQSLHGDNEMVRIAREYEKAVDAQAENYNDWTQGFW